MSDATMSAIRVRDDHTTQAIVLLSAPIFGKDKPIGPQVTAIATALADQEAAVWQKAAEWHMGRAIEHAQFRQNALDRDDYDAADMHDTTKDYHQHSAGHCRTQAAQIRGKEWEVSG